MIQYIILSLALLSPLALANCDDAIDLLHQAKDLHQQDNIENEKLLINMALILCPNLPEAHNYLASLFEAEHEYTQAIYHFKKALNLRPDFSEAWYGLGETYYKQGRFPLSLEAHLQACQKDKDSKKRIEDLLKSQDYAVESGKILDKESLLVLFDPSRQAKIDSMLKSCHLRMSRVKPAATFRNFQFAKGESSLHDVQSRRQIEEIVAALISLPHRNIEIHGHTDTQAFKNTSSSSNNRLNLKLSKQRARTIANALISRGIAKHRIKIYGHGYHNPLINENNPKAWKQNRRVVLQ